MKPARQASLARNAVAVDFETDLIQPGLNAPPPVCAGVALVGANGQVVRRTLLADDALVAMDEVFADPNKVYVNARAAFDILVYMAERARQGIDVAPAVFAKLDPTGGVTRGDVDGGVVCTLLVEQLHHVAQGHLTRDPFTHRELVDPSDSSKTGSYTHATVHQLVTGDPGAKTNDRFRLRYFELRKKPLDQWPHEAREYPGDDARNALVDVLGQAGLMPSVWPHEWKDTGNASVCVNCHQTLTLSGPPPTCVIQKPRRNFHEVSRRTYFSVAAALGDAWGFRVDQAMVDKIEAHFGPEFERAGQQFRDVGIVREDGSENTSVLKKLVATAYGSTSQCRKCDGSGRVPSEKTAGKTKVACVACDGTGLDLHPAVPRTDKMHVSASGDALQESGDDVLIEYHEHGKFEKLRSTYIPLMRQGRACVECGQPGAGKRQHKETCRYVIEGRAATFRDVPLLPRTRDLVETGRCAVGGGLHGLPRKGIPKVGGIRECIMARNGYVLSSEDYTAGELVTLAETCVDLVEFSRLGEALNIGLDAHLALAGTMSGRSYEEMKALKAALDKLADDLRQAAKAGNFGFGGGMAELTFTTRNRSNPDLFTMHPNGPSKNAKGKSGWPGLRTCILMDGAERCGWKNGRKNTVMEYRDTPCPPTCLDCILSGKRLREFWHKQWPEMQLFFNKVKKLIATVGPSGTAEIIHLGSNRIRGGVGFCDGANGLFQGRLADAATDAYCQIQRECADRSWRVRSSEMVTSKYEGLESPLLGSRAILLMHDEPLCEHPESQAHDAAHRVSEIMVECLRFRCPHHRKAVKAEPTLMRRWYKGAEPRWKRGGAKRADENDTLVPWEPEKKAA